MLGDLFSQQTEISVGVRRMSVDVLYVVPQVHRIASVALHQKYSSGIVFIFSHGRKYLYHV
jgi:hypothetical protein